MTKAELIAKASAFLEKADKATPGPWRWDAYQMYLMADNDFIACDDVGGLMMRGVGPGLPIEQNADLLCAARNDAPEIIKELLKLI